MTTPEAWAAITVDWSSVDGWAGAVLALLCAVWALQRAIRLIRG